jgi:CRP-like cAMP-binding protein
MDNSVAQKVEAFFGQYRPRTYRKGQILIHAGDEPEHIYNIVSGQVRQYDISYRGDEVVVNVFKAPAFFPMSWALNRTPNVYFFEAATDVELRLAPPDETVEFLRQNPDVLLDLLSRVYKGTDGLLRRMAHLMGGSAKSRLLFELIIGVKRFGEQGRDGAWFVAMHESDLATLAGMSRETVSREMRKLKESGLVKVTHQGVTIDNLAVLEAELGSGL